VRELRSYKELSPNKCCLENLAFFVAVVKDELEASKDLAEFSSRFSELELLLKAARKLSKEEYKFPHLKYGAGCKTCKLKSAKRCRECLASARAVYKS
jgi:hypothetical protein